MANQEILLPYGSTDSWGISQCAIALAKKLKGDQATKTKRGFKVLIDAMSSSLPSSYKVYLNQIVSRIDISQIYYSTGNKITLYTNLNKTFQADYVILTSSLGHLKQYGNSLFYPPNYYFLYKYNVLIERLNFSVAEKAFIVFDKPVSDTVRGVEFKLLWDKDLDFLDSKYNLKVK